MWCPPSCSERLWTDFDQSGARTKRISVREQSSFRLLGSRCRRQSRPVLVEFGPVSIEIRRKSAGSVASVAQCRQLSLSLLAYPTRPITTTSSAGHILQLARNSPFAGLQPLPRVPLGLLRPANIAGSARSSRATPSEAEPEAACHSSRARYEMCNLKPFRQTFPIKAEALKLREAGFPPNVKVALRSLSWLQWSGTSTRRKL